MIRTQVQASFQLGITDDQTTWIGQKPDRPDVSRCCALRPGHANASRRRTLQLPHACWRQREWSRPSYRQKQVQRPKGLIGNAIGRTNWNTDFVVDQPSNRFKLFFTADSTEGTPESYPIEADLKFADGSNMKVVD